MLEVGPLTLAALVVKTGLDLVEVGFPILEQSLGVQCFGDGLEERLFGSFDLVHLFRVGGDPLAFELPISHKCLEAVLEIILSHGLIVHNGNTHQQELDE